MASPSISPPRVTAAWTARVHAARHSLLGYAALTPHEFAARQRAAFIRHLSHHYYNPYNATYRQVVQRHGVAWGEPTAAGGRFGRFFARRTATNPVPQLVPIPAAMPLSDILAQLPVVDKALLTAGDYLRQPCVTADEVGANPASSGTTSGQRAYTALARQSIWPFAGETAIWLLLMNGIDPLTAPGYFVAHFLRDDSADQRASATFTAFSSLQRAAPALHTLGSTQDSLDAHAERLAQAQWSFSSPHFYRQLVARSPRDMCGSPLEVVLCGGGVQSDEDRAIVIDQLGLREMLNVYAVSEGGVVGAQLRTGSPYSSILDRYLVEVLDDHDRPVAPGARGTVALTSLLHSGTPIVRYRIGDEARALGSFAANGDLWHDLGLALPTAGWDAESLYMGAFLRFGTWFDGITRANGLIIGDAKIGYEDVAAMQAHLARLGTPVAVLQLARRQAADGRHLLVARVEAPHDMNDAVRANMMAALRQSGQLAYLFDDGELPPPEIEVLAPGALSAGAFKVPMLVDESRQRVPVAR